MKALLRRLKERGRAKMISSIIVTILAGLVGGILNCILFERGFIMPSRETIDDSKNRFNPGFLGNIALGIGASLIIWGLGASDFPMGRMIAVCTLSGIGGGNLITSMLQKHQLDLANSKIDAISDNFNELIRKFKGV